MEIPNYVLRAQETVRQGRFLKGALYYLGDMCPDKVGEVLYDPDENVWIVRELTEDQEFPCGRDCCGIAHYAVVAIPVPPEVKS